MYRTVLGALFVPQQLTRRSCNEEVQFARSRDPHDAPRLEDGPGLVREGILDMAQEDFRVRDSLHAPLLLDGAHGLVQEDVFFGRSGRRNDQRVPGDLPPHPEARDHAE